MKLRLAAGDRDFFSLVARAAYANPFGSERYRLDGAIGDTSVDDPTVVERAAARVEARLTALANGKRPLSIVAYADSDRELLYAAVLFDAFHRFSPALDTLIEGETRRDPEASSVSFARELVDFLQVRGFEPRESIRALELFYQMRRAHSAVATRLIGGGPSMRKLREDLWNTSFTRDIRRYERFLWSRMEDFSTLLLGETGTGKGEAAQAIGRSGFIPFDEKRERFSTSHSDLLVPIHLSEFPETLLESELFGHKKGAFTGAIENHDGVLARTREHGTLFLDEIGEVSLPVQVKLLRVLQERTYTPVGGRESRRFAGRIVAATHRPLAELRQQGRMRDDFFFRLSTQSIHVPSLRTRLGENPGELTLLVENLCTRIVGQADAELAAEVRTAIERDLGSDYGFPGNVRELEQCVRRVLLTGACTADSASAAPGSHAGSELGELDWSAEQLLGRYCAALYQRHQSYVEVARITGLDRRTVKKHIDDVRARP